MKDQLVTVIIPVYKTRQFLEKCLNSVLEQDYPELEIILVDDGSPDSCPELCDQYAKEYNNITTIHQPNQGLGIARNTGLEAAKGKYITFLDSDDQLDGAGAIRALVEKAEEKQADIVVGAFRRFHGEEISGINHHHLREGDYTRTIDFRFKGFYMYGHLAYDWGKLYRRAFLTDNDIKCRAYPFTQDKAHNLVCCAYEPVYAFIDKSVYLYQINEESVTFRYKDNLIPVWIAIASDFEQLLKERKIPRSYNDLTAFHLFFGMFFLVKQELMQEKHGISASAKVLSRYGKDSLVHSRIKDLALGRYLKQIDSKVWKIVIRGASGLFYLRAYHLLAFGIAVLRKMGFDGKITKSRYKHDDNKNAMKDV